MINQQQLINITTDRFVPADAAGTGTITTSGVTFSLSSAGAVKIGDYVTDATQGESRKVIFVNHVGDNGTLEAAFTSDLSALSLTKIDAQDAKVIALGVAADQSSNTEVDGNVLTSGSSLNWATPPNKASQGIGFVRPVYIEGSTVGACTVSVELHRNY